MNTQPEALRLADLLLERERDIVDFLPEKAAAELRRLHEENQALRQALAEPEQEPVAWMLHFTNEGGVPIRETFYSKDHMEFHKSHNEVHRGLKCEVTPLHKSPPNSHEYARAIEAKLKENT